MPLMSYSWRRLPATFTCTRIAIATRSTLKQQITFNCATNAHPTFTILTVLEMANKALRFLHSRAFCTFLQNGLDLGQAKLTVVIRQHGW